jgi:predicted SAM-dependent methyltransferase
MNAKLKSKLKSFFGDFWWDYLVKTKNNFLQEYRISQDIQKSQKFFSSIDGPFKLQLGCGGRIKPGWINTDLSQNSEGSVDGILDLRRPFPFASETCLEIYSNHVFEHLPYPNIAEHILRESHRILVPEGLFRVVVPDLQSFQDPNRYEEWKLYAEWVLSCKNPEIVFGTQAEVVNHLFRQGGQHHFIYDYDTIYKLLEKAGFREIVKSDHDLQKDFQVKSLPSMYVNAIK